MSGAGRRSILKIFATYGHFHPISSAHRGQRLQRVLVVVPTYNELDNLPRLIPSILAQDSRLEVLVVDDASPDGTGLAADRLAAEEPRVHVLHRAG